MSGRGRISDIGGGGGRHMMIAEIVRDAGHIIFAYDVHNRGIFYFFVTLIKNRPAQHILLSILISVKCRSMASCTEQIFIDLISLNLTFKHVIGCHKLFQFISNSLRH